MNNAPGAPEHDHLSAYRAGEPRRARDPFANPTLRSEIARIAEARAQRAASGWRAALFGWVSAAPRGAIAGVALSMTLLLGGVAGQFAGGIESSARMQAGADTLESTMLPSASLEVKVGAEGDTYGEPVITDGVTIISGAALLLLSGSLLVASMIVRRRRA